jgi:hypothetical protein
VYVSCVELVYEAGNSETGKHQKYMIVDKNIHSISSFLVIAQAFKLDWIYFPCRLSVFKT